jgi:hypothetical protein
MRAVTTHKHKYERLHCTGRPVNFRREAGIEQIADGADGTSLLRDRIIHQDYAAHRQVLPGSRYGTSVPVPPIWTADALRDDGFHLAGEFDRVAYQIRLQYPTNLVQASFRAPFDTPGSHRATPGLLDAASTLEHELTHWTDTIGTAYGFFQLDSDAALPNALGNFLDKYEEADLGPPFPRPVAGYVRRRLPEAVREVSGYVRRGGDPMVWNARPANVALDAGYQALMLLTLIDVCDGITDVSKPHADWFRWCSPTVLEAGLQLELPVADISTAMAQQLVCGHHEGSAVPRSVSGKTFGAVAVMEGHAHGLELLRGYAVMTESQGDFLSEFAIARNVALYDEAFQVFRRIVSEGLARSRLEYVLTYLAICDLALASPIHPVYFGIGAEMSWRDLHPGWRFVRAAHTVAATGLIDHHAFPLDDQGHHAFALLQERVCNTRGWPTPSRLAKDILAFDGAVPEARELAFEAYRASCGLRLAYPGLFATGQLADSATIAAVRARLPQPLIVSYEGEVFAAGWPTLPEIDEDDMLARLAGLGEAQTMTRFLLRHADEWDALEAAIKPLFYHLSLDDILSAFDVDRDGFELRL